VSQAHRAFVVGWAFGVAGIAAGELGAGGWIAGPLMAAGAAALGGSGLLMLSGRGGAYRGTPLTPFFGAIVLIIGALWAVFAVAVMVDGW
jgi:hypothetical protein